MHPRLSLVALLVLLVSCADDPPDSSTSAVPTGTGLLAQGCPVAGKAAARTLLDASERPSGEHALAAPGDVVLLNTRAAWVIQGVDAPRTYVHYGGAPIDAVALKGCAQAGPERFGEIALVFGQLVLTDFTASTLRMFRGERVEIVSDGADGGPAVVEVHGVDDIFHLVELTLMGEAYEAGRPKQPSVATGLDLTIRYTLAPDDPVLGMELLVEGEGDPQGYLAGLITIPGDRTREYAWTDGRLSVGGFGLDLGAPWFTATSPEGSWAVGLVDGTLARTEISGVSPLLDVRQATSAPLKPTAGSPASMSFALSVGAGDSPSATVPLAAHLTARFPDPGASSRALDLVVRDEGGQAVAGATGWLEAPSQDGAWKVLDRVTTGADGRWTGTATDPGSGLRVRVEAAGRDVLTAPVVVSGTRSSVEVTTTLAGAVDVVVTDQAGTPVPARVEFLRADGVRTTAYVTPGDAPVSVPPGSTTVRVSRGYEYAPRTLALDVAAGSTTTLETTLEHAVDTTGWVSIDTHVHAEASADSTVLAADRFRTAAAGGLDVVVSTDHEAILDLRAGRAEAGLDADVGYALGSEITASLPEHVNAWPFPVRSDDPRGDFVRWYGLGLGGIYDAARARGARVVQLNHPRVNGSCGILCLIDFDRVTATPRLTDPTLLGMPADAGTWDWDFDALELINGQRSPFLEPADPRRTGVFEDWLSFLNHGHAITAVAVTDVHGDDLPGAPRTYLEVGDDDTAAVPEDALVDAMRGGHAVVSVGAFARVGIGGAGPGDTVRVTGGPATLDLHVEAVPAVDVSHIEVLVNCDEVLDLPTTDPGGVVKLDTSVALSLTQDAHVVVLGMGEGPLPDGLPALEMARVPRFVTNPIWVDVDGDGRITPRGDVERCVGADARGER